MTYPIAVFDQHMVVATNGNQEQHNLYVVENVDPLLSL